MTRKPWPLCAISGATALGWWLLAGSAAAEGATDASPPAPDTAPRERSSSTVPPLHSSVPQAQPPVPMPAPTNQGQQAPTNARSPVVEKHDSPFTRTTSSNDRVAFLGHLGIGAPAGAVGVDLDLYPIEWVGLTAGAGLSVGGPQVAVGGRVRLPWPESSDYLSVGSSISFGRYETSRRCEGFGYALTFLWTGNGEPSASKTWDRAYWYNFEFGYDHRNETGTGVSRVALGYGFILNGNDYACDGSEDRGSDGSNRCGRSGGSSLLYAVYAIGFAL